MSKFIHIERSFVTKSLEENGTFEGYASVFGVEDSHKETVVKGAFKKGLEKLIKEKRRVKMLWSHDTDQPIGVYKDVDEDDDGLYVRGKLTVGVQKADETRLLMLDEAVDSMSIGAYVVRDLIDKVTRARSYLELELREISPVVFPALSNARIVSVKSMLDNASIPEVEACLRDVGGFSLKEAKCIISTIKAATPHRDVERAATLIQTAINNLKG